MPTAETIRRANPFEHSFRNANKIIGAVNGHVGSLKASIAGEWTGEGECGMCFTG